MAASGLLVTAPRAMAAPPDSIVTVSIVDQYGRPTPGLVELYSSGGSGFYGDGSNPEAVATTQNVTVPSDDSYAVEVVTPWPTSARGSGNPGSAKPSRRAPASASQPSQSAPNRASALSAGGAK